MCQCPDNWCTMPHPNCLMFADSQNCSLFNFTSDGFEVFFYRNLFFFFVVVVVASLRFGLVGAIFPLT